MRPRGLLVGGGQDGPALARAMVVAGLAGGAEEVVVVVAVEKGQVEVMVESKISTSEFALACERRWLTVPGSTVTISIDAELQEVREVLDSTSKRCLPDGPCWCKSYLPTLGHTEDCQRARALLEKLEVRP